MSNMPPGCESGGFRYELLELYCPNGHRFERPGYFELGGYFLIDEENVNCDICGEEGA